MKLWAVIDIGCHECGVSSVAVGLFRSKQEADKAVDECDERTGCWRDGGQTWAMAFEFELSEGGGE